MQPLFIRFFYYSSIATLFFLSYPQHSYACGGFFCRSFPVNQVNERILFVKDEDTITTHVQIQYNGSASDFAWILPVPAVPELSISHNDLFTQLQFATEPTFILNYQEGDECNPFFSLFPPFLETVLRTEEDGVQVISAEQIGPYDTVLITAEDPDAVIQWLEENEYNLDALGANLLRPYVEAGMYFLALRLAPDRDLGDLQPIGLTYAASQPGIPIRLTAVATQPNMGVLVWILGEERAIPQNYLHVQINEAQIDWFNGGFNYNDIVTEAANEADGQAFVTDYAGSSKIMAQRLFTEDRYTLRGLSEITDPSRFINALLERGFPRDAQMQTLLRRYIPMPSQVLTEGVLQVVFGGDKKAFQQAVDDSTLQGIAEFSFYNNINAYEEWLGPYEFDPEDLILAIENIIVTPLRETQALFDTHPYLTRLYTTLSAEEMTLDPLFAFNPDLPEVSNIRNAKAHFECPDNEEPLPQDIVLVITLKDGRIIRTNPFADVGPMPLPRPFEAAAGIIEQMDTSGPPTVLVRATAINSPTSTIGETPSEFSLSENFPNPFNAETNFSFSVPTTAANTRVSLKIYNLLGQAIRTIWSATAQPGTYRFTWDGRNAQNIDVTSGVYLYRLEGNQVELTRKLLLLR